jgi:hypothetical protein
MIYKLFQIHEKYPLCNFTIYNRVNKLPCLFGLTVKMAAR